MARNWTVQIQGGIGSDRPASAFAAQDTLPATFRPCDAFDDSTDESVWLQFVVPEEHTGTGTLKLRIKYCANTTTAADDVRIDVATEFRTPAAGESANAANFDGVADGATGTFSATAYSVQELTIALTPATTPVKGDIARIQVTRDANHATDDSLTGDLFVLWYEVYEEA